MALTEGQISAMYEAAKRVYAGNQRAARAIDGLEAAGVSRAVAAACIRNYQHMRRGERYRRTLTGPTATFMLDRIFRELGPEGLRLALSSLLAHIEYLEPIRKSACRRERRLYEQYSALLSVAAEPIYPDEVSASRSDDRNFVEGATRQVLVNQYERDRRARIECIRHWGTACYVCGFDFHRTYGEMGFGFIHVHHLTDIASIGAKYEVDPRADLRPVCPNCHAMLHTQRPAIDIHELKSMLAARQTD
ncbi:HNH endonuclease [Caballeronia sp. AZ7_KS35]|uniref:HNH endonuclease n=1 Tax=Caballeronia sp. AZ7_KS35 TaxID=2921762 RepID=UPI0020292698|nr:HNH endonuclease [Caballeronia sp. AZ7_KS35]